MISSVDEDTKCHFYDNAEDACYAELVEPFYELDDPLNRQIIDKYTRIEENKKFLSSI